MKHFLKINTSKRLNVRDFETHAQKILSPQIFNFISGGAADEFTLAENELCYKNLNLLPKILRGVKKPDTTTELLGNTLNSPILIAPMAFQNLIHPLGEEATISAANKTQTPYIVSTFTTTPLSGIVESAIVPLWFQLYILKDRDFTQDLIQKVERLGFKALVLTVDVPVYGKRERELLAPLQEKFKLPELENVVNFPSPAAAFSALLDTNLTWDDVAWVKSITKLPIILKGVLREDDALRSLDCGVSALILSNHGGRQLDTTPPAITVLPKIAEVINNKMDILIDGGIRRGTDIIKALALGAKAVLIGRPILWGLSIDGGNGVCEVLKLLITEFEQAMILCGCQNVDEITRDLVLET
ncbi:MAG: alpha-hydroxy-acid oxidizing protein [Alphaproteobacteria bacterium]|jgi:4-hydroxymandelate oxidase|nr:alpha-hydroxy-acid oxidizing protein [Alphaproteobacteria bacterium]MBT6183102.1 alpha-hydroxy-acid oxidizing protein [archaeon]